MNSDDRRLFILNKSEISDIYGLPQLSDVQRDECFSLSSHEFTAMQEIRSVKSKAFFILNLEWSFNCARYFWVGLLCYSLLSTVLYEV